MKKKSLKQLFLLGLMFIGGALKAQPVVSSLSATTGAPGSSITISGSGFNTTAANNVVYFGATKATVTSASATSLTVTVPVGATYAPVSVTNTITALTGSSAKTFAPTFSNTSYISGYFNFEPKKNFGTGSDFVAHDMDMVDIDGDGKTDMVIAPGNLSISRNTNDADHLIPGSFTSASFALASTSGYQAVGDINGDGKKDIIVSMSTGGFSVFRNTSASGSLSSSSLATRVDISATGNGMLAVADFNGDGKPDIVQGNTTDHLITIFQNTSSGSTISFAAGVNFATDHGGTIIRVADIDLDGKADILTNYEPVWAPGDPLPFDPSGFSIFRNVMSSGAITTASLSRIDYSASYDEVVDLMLNDIDIDGKPEIVVIHTGSGTSNCAIYQNNTTMGSITGTSFSSTGFNFGYFKGIGDLDGDGRPEIISNINIEYEYPDYTYLAGVPNYTGNFSGDGYGYIPYSGAGWGIAIYRNMSTTGTINTSSFSGAIKYYDLDGTDGLGTIMYSTTDILKIFVADMDGDGKSDICAMRKDDVGIFRNKPLKMPTTVTSLSAVSGNPGSPITINGTNFNTTATGNSVYFGATKAEVTSASATALTVTVPLGATYEPVSVTDMTKGFTVFSPLPFLQSFDHSAYTAGTINFDPNVNIPVPLNLFASFGDVDGDGKPDMMLRNEAAISVYRNISTSGSITPGSFATPVNFAIAGSGYYSEILFHDVDMDGKADIIAGCTTSSGQGYFSILKNTATSGMINTGSFATHFDIPVETPGHADIGDVDGDGKPEIIFVASTGGYPTNMGILQNKTTPGVIDSNSFAREVVLDIAGSSTQEIKLRDMDGDGKNDLILTDFLGGTTIFRNMSRMGAIVGTVSPSHTYDFMPINRGILQCFATGVGAGAFGYHRAEIIGDMDGDGKADLVYTNDTSLVVSRNTSTPGTLSFAAPVIFNHGVLANTVKLGDMDGDGKADVICSYIWNPSGNDSGVLVYRNLATPGSFTTSSLAAPKQFPCPVAAEDLDIVDIDGDGKSDIAVNCTGGYAGVLQMSILRNDPERIEGPDHVCIGSTITLTDGVVTGTWSSGNTAIATVGTGTGIVTGVASGTAVISYSFSGGVATKIITVGAMPATITGTLTVCQAATTTLSNTTGGGTWSSGNTAVATVSSAGVVTGIGGGTAVITYFTGCTDGATAIVTVTPLPAPSSIFGDATACIGATTTLYNTYGGGVWSSSDPAIASIDAATGVVTPLVTGTVNITYTGTNSCGTVSVTRLETVNILPSSITGTFTICVGSTATLSSSPSGGVWTSYTTANATIGSASGIVTGVHTGTSFILYALNGCYATKTITVNAASTGAGTVTGTATVCAGVTTTLSNTVGGGSWSSDATGIATVNTEGVVTGVAAGTAVISYMVTTSCGSAVATKIVTVNAVPDAGTITGTATVCTAATTTLSNTVSGGTWSSGTTSVASVGSNTGVVTGLASGTALITYTVSNSCGTATATRIVTVNSAPSAGSISGASSVAVGASLTLSSSVSGGTWSASNSNATVSSTGVVTGVSAGTVTISYTVTNSCGTAVATRVITVGTSLGAIMGTLSTCAGSATALSHATPGGWWGSSNFAVATVSTTGVVTGVAAGTATITYLLGGSSVAAIITVNPLPATISGASGVCLGAATNLSDATTGGTWSSSNASIASAGMSTGVITGVATGTVAISYTLPTGCYRTLSVTVKPLPAAITGAASLCPGSTAAYTDATTGGLSWSSSNTAVGTINAASGVLTAIASGTTTISYTVVSGCIATRIVTVNSLPAAISGTPLACAGSTAALTDADAGGAWSSSATGVATIGSTGVVTALAAGVTNIIYSTGAGCNRSVAFTVNPLPAVITGGTTLCAGSTTALADATTGGAWTSGSTSVATVSAGGLVTGMSTGTSVITYALSTGCSRTTTVSVSGSISAITGMLSACIGSSTALANATSGGTWSSSNPVIATVSTSGLVTGMATGVANITYTVASCRAVVSVTVAASIPAITGTASVCVNATTTLSDAVAGGAWSSSNPALGTVSASGVVTGIAAGTPTITYAAGGCYRVQNVTVKPLPGAISGNTGLCVGATSTLTDGTGVSWSSSTPAVATIGAASGVITGVSAGTSTITFNATNGCIATKVVTVDAAPAVSAITGPAGVAIGHTITLANATPGGIWSSNNTARATVSAGGVVTGIAVPAATISYTITNGVCNVSVTKLISITTSRPELAEAALQGADIRVYPNPTAGMFTVQTSVAGTFTVYTLEGKEVLHIAVSTGANQISLPKELAAGIYMCRFNGDDNSAVMVRLVYEQ